MTQHDDPTARPDPIPRYEVSYVDGSRPVAIACQTDNLPEALMSVRGLERDHMHDIVVWDRVAAYWVDDGHRDAISTRRPGALPVADARIEPSEPLEPDEPTRPTPAQLARATHHYSAIAGGPVRIEWAHGMLEVHAESSYATVRLIRTMPADDSVKLLLKDAAGAFLLLIEPVRSVDVRPHLGPRPGTMPADLPARLQETPRATHAPRQAPQTAEVTKRANLKP